MLGIVLRLSNAVCSAQRAGVSGWSALVGLSLLYCHPRACRCSPCIRRLPVVHLSESATAIAGSARGAWADLHRPQRSTNQALSASDAAKRSSSAQTSAMRPAITRRPVPAASEERRSTLVVRGPQEAVPTADRKACRLLPAMCVGRKERCVSGKRAGLSGARTGGLAVNGQFPRGARCAWCCSAP